MLLMQTLHVQLLGDFSVDFGGAPAIPVNSARLQSLLAYLILRRDSPQPRRKISFLFWPDSEETQARTNLRKLLYDLKHTLPDIEQFIDLEGPTLDWRADESVFDLDVEKFEQALKQAQSVADLREAVALYQGELLPNCYDDWILLERQRLHQLYMDALDQLIAQLENQRDYRAAINYAQRMMQHAPLEEETYRRLMRLYALKGDRAGVLRTYHACATTLQRELEVEPSEITRKEYERLLNLDSPLSQLPVVNSDLIGRNAEWAQMQAAWRTAFSGQPHWLLLSGEDGVGKTRLAEELLHWASRQGIATASSQCYPADRGLAYAPVTNLLRSRPLAQLNKLWLTEIARLLPEILVDHPNLSPPGPLKEPWQRHRFFEALARDMLAKQPLVLLLDDLQWCDSDSIEWLHYLSHFDPQSRLLIVSTLNPSDLVPDSSPEVLLSTLRRSSSLTEINLKPLNEDETALLVSNVSGKEVSKAESARLFKETKGNPLFALEMIRSGLPEKEQANNGQNPKTIQNAFEARLSQLSAPARELTGLAATVGRAFTFDVLAHASDVSEDELMRGLDELWQRKIVREQAANAYDFSHSKLGEAAYAGLDTVKQQLLHRRVAEALEATAESDLDLVSGEIASHFEQAGLLDRAIPYYIRAGDSSREVYANQAAIEYYQRVLSLLPEGDKVDVMLKLGQVWLLVGNWTEAEALFWQALRLSQGEYDLHVQARCEAALGETLHLKGSYVEALSWLERARDTFDQLDDQKGLCGVLGSIGKVYFWQLDNTSALRSFEQQLQIASQISDQGSIGSSSGSMGLVYWQMGENDRALNYFKQQLQVAKETSDLSGTSLAIGRIGLVYWTWGDFERALEFFEQQLQIANEIGDRLGVGLAVGNIGNVFFKQGNFSRAMEYYTQQLRIAKGLGERREISHALRNMGMLFAEQGAFEQALSCHTQSLQIAIEMETARAIGRAIGEIAIAYAVQEEFARAEELFQQVRNLIPESALPYYLCKYIYQYAAMLAHQERYEDALSMNSQAADIARRIKRKDIQFKTELLEIRLETALHQIKPAMAANRYLSLLPEWPAEDEQVVIYDALFTLGVGNKEEIDTYRQMTVELYRALYSQTPKFEYRQRYEEITGERLSEPDSIAELPEVMGDGTLDLDALLKQVNLMSDEIHKVRV